MSAFQTDSWRVLRADALETEAEAVDLALVTLQSVLELADKIELQAMKQAIGVLGQIRDTRREQAAKLRIAA